MTAPTSSRAAPHRLGARLLHYISATPRVESAKPSEDKVSHHSTAISTSGLADSTDSRSPEALECSHRSRKFGKKDLHELHKHLGHETFTQVQNFFRDAKS